MSADYKHYHETPISQKHRGLESELEAVSILSNAGFDTRHLSAMVKYGRPVLNLPTGSITAPDILAGHSGYSFAFEIKTKAPTKYRCYGIPTDELNTLKTLKRQAFICFVMVKDTSQQGSWFVWRLDLAALDRYASYGNEGRQTFIPARLFSPFDPADLVPPTIH